MKPIHYQHDHFASLAKQHKYRSRAAFKLLEIQQKYNIITSHDLVLDIGAAPGSWSQIANQFTRKPITAIDPLLIQPLHNVHFIQSTFQNNIPHNNFTVVISDMCPNKTGNKTIDTYNMFDLTTQLIAQTTFSTKFVCKSFDSTYSQQLTSLLQAHYTKIIRFKPQSSRDCSSEFYYLCWK